MGDALPLGTLLGFAFPPIGFIVAIICYYVFSSQED
jgi:hypothetical protein